MGVLSAKSVTVETMCKNQTQRIIRLITPSTVNVLENVQVGASRTVLQMANYEPMRKDEGVPDSKELDIEW